MKTRRTKISFKRGDDVHLDTIYDVQAFCMMFLKPVNLYKISGWNPDMTDTFRCTKGFSIEVLVKSN